MYAVTLGRVSSIKQDGNSSVEAQQQLSKKFLEEQGYTIVASFDETRSGRQDRETVQEAYDFISKWNKGHKRKKITVLAVLDWSRWFRNQDLSGYWRTMFSRIGVEVNATNEWYKGDEAGDIYMRAIKIAAAEAESLENSKRTKRGMYFTAKKGYLMSNAPKGVIKRKEPKGDKDIIDVHPEFGPIYRKLFQRIAAGVQPMQLYRQLGGKEIFGSTSTFYEAIRNPIYCGWTVFKSNIADMPDLTVNLKAYDTVIDKATFDAVQQILNKSKQLNKTNNNGFFAKRSLLCPECSQNVTSDRNKGRSKHYEYYRCHRGNNHFRVSKEVANDLISNVVKGFALSDNLLAEAKIKLDEKVRVFRKKLGYEIGQLKRRVNQAEERQNKALKLFLDGNIDQKDLDSIKADTQAIRTELSKKEFLKVHQFDITKKAMVMLQMIGTAWDRFDEVGKSQFLKMAFPEGFYIDQDSVTQEYYLRTAKLNSIFNVIGLKPDSYDRLKIGNSQQMLTIPFKQPVREQMRTEISEEIRAFHLFFNQYLAA